MVVFLSLEETSKFIILLVVLEEVLIFHVVSLLDVRLVSFSFRESPLNENDEIHSTVQLVQM